MNIRISPRLFSALLLALLVAPLAQAAPAANEASPKSANAPAAERRAVELTFLKSLPGQREQLKAFIVANWFAMDKIAKDQGLMAAYSVMDTGSDEGPWNVLVSVTYNNERGYEGIIEAFEKIRAAHKTVRIDGKGLKELGAIVESKKVFENPAHSSR
jgi:hypothetical protein